MIAFPKDVPFSKVADDAPQYGAKKKAVRPLNGRLDFRIFDNPAAMERSLRDRMAEENSARILAPYARPWETRGQSAPHDLPYQMKDLVIPYEEYGDKKTWARI